MLGRMPDPSGGPVAGQLEHNLADLTAGEVADAFDLAGEAGEAGQ